MALKSTIFKVELQIADMDRHYYATHALTLARHPSETDERMMVRVLAFAFFASERLAFGKGLSEDDEPALVACNYDGSVDLWVEVGLPDEKRLRKAASRASRVVVVAYGGRVADLWWEKLASRVAGLKNLLVLSLAGEESLALSALAQRSMRLQCTLQDGSVLLTDEKEALGLHPKTTMGVWP